MKTRTRRSLAVVVLATVLGLAGHAYGADALLAGTRLVLTPLQLGVLSHDASIGLAGGKGSADDPMLHGATLRVLSIDGDVFDQTYALPASGWRYVRRQQPPGSINGYAFHGAAPIRSVLVKAGKVIQIAGGRTGLGHTLGGNPAPVRVVLTLGGQQYCMSFGNTIEFKPGVRYRATHGAAPDVCPLPYGKDNLWLCRPGITNNQCFVNSLDATVIHPDLSQTLEPEVGAENQPYDCFYVYPTVDLGSPPGNVPDPTAPGFVSLTLDPLLAQAARFNGQCRIFAPHYRQETILTFLLNDPNSPRYADLAYHDVLDAWRLYLKYYNGGRNVVIMGHSQGTFMLTRLVQEEVDPSPALRSRLIAALLIGGRVGVPEGGVVGGSFQNIPLCTTAAQTGCVIAYRSFAEGFPPVNGSNNVAGPNLDVACTNPAALGSSAAGAFVGTYFPTHANQPLFNIVPNPGFTTPFVEFPEFYAGACVKDDTNHSYLQIRVRPGPGDQRQNLVPFTNGVLSPALLGTHILDYSWPLRDLLSLVATKAAAMP